MTKTIYSHFDKKILSTLPVVTYPGRIISIITAGEAEKAVEYLLESDILGMDTETKPVFSRKEKKRKVALLQVSTRDTCFLFRLNLIGITPAIKRLLEDQTVLKVGLSWHDDLRMLEDRAKFVPGLFVDIQNIVGKIGIEDLSLQKIYANLFHKKISKRQRLTNWEASVLTDKQKVYAAIDAWSCIYIYEEIMRLAATGDYELIKVNPNPAPTASASPAKLEEKAGQADGQTTDIKQDK